MNGPTPTLSGSFPRIVARASDARRSLNCVAHVRLSIFRVSQPVHGGQQ
jgi:hypothetical protein